MTVSGVSGDGTHQILRRVADDIDTRRKQENDRKSAELHWSPV